MSSASPRCRHRDSHPLGSRPPCRRQGGIVVGLKDEARSSASRSRLLPGWSLAGGALTCSVVGAGLFIRTVQNLQRFDPGFVRDGVLLVDFEGQRPRWSGELLDELRRMPGVASASASTHTPLSGSTWSEAVVPAGRPLPNRDNAVLIGAGPGFFTTMRIPVLSGREVTAQDSAARTAVAVLYEPYAPQNFPGLNPVGLHDGRLSSPETSPDRRPGEEHEHAQPAPRTAGNRVPGLPPASGQSRRSGVHPGDSDGRQTR